jgi:hypothetical protein
MAKKVAYICKKHGIIHQCAKDHVSGRKCSECKHRISVERRSLGVLEFINRASKIHNGKYDYSSVEYKNRSTPIKIICSIHGLFYQKPSEHLAGSGCQKCSGKYRYNKEDFLFLANRTHGNRYDYSTIKFKKMSGKLEIICRIHGSFSQTGTNHIFRKQGCSKCSGTSTSTTIEFINKSKIIHGPLYDYSEVKYTNAKTKVRIKCHKHGIFEQRPNDHLTGFGCSSCSYNISDKEINWLNSMNVPNDRNHRQVKLNMLDGSTIKVDGYIKKLNTVYEFWGDWWHGNPKFYSKEKLHPKIKKSYGQLYIETLSKIKLIQESGFDLIDIWENDYDQGTK